MHDEYGSCTMNQIVRNRLLLVCSNKNKGYSSRLTFFTINNSLTLTSVVTLLMQFEVGGDNMRKLITLIVLLGATILALMPVQPVQPVRKVQAEVYYFDPPPTTWAGQLIYTSYYPDETFTGPSFFTCEANTCTGIEYCPLPKTPYFIEVRRITVSCTGIV